MSGVHTAVDAPRVAEAGLFETVLTRLREEAGDHLGGTNVRLVPLAYLERPFSHILRVAVYGGEASRPDLHIFIKLFKPKTSDGGMEKMRVRVAHDFQLTCRV